MRDEGAGEGRSLEMKGHLAPNGDDYLVCRPSPVWTNRKRFGARSLFQAQNLDQPNHFPP